MPLGTRSAVGVVWDEPPDASIGHNRLRPVTGAFDVAPLAKEMRTFVDWVANYTLTPRGMVLRMVLRSPAALSPEAMAFYSENRRVANGKAKRMLGWSPRFADYRAGLADCLRCYAP